MPTSTNPSYKLTPVDFNPFSADNNALARAGRSGDSLIAHLTPGDYTIPIEKQTPEILSQIKGWMGTEYTHYLAGHPDNPINPDTGFRQFDSESGGEGPGAEGGAGAGGGTGGPGTGTSDSGPGAEGGNSPSAGNPNTTADLTDNPGISSGSKSSTAVGEDTGEEQSLSDTSLGNTLGNFAQHISTAAINKVNNTLQDIADHPAKFGINLAVGLLTTGVVPAANALSGFFGGPTIGGTVEAGGKAAISAAGGGTPTDTSGKNGGGSSDIFNSSNSIDAAALVKSLTDSSTGSVNTTGSGATKKVLIDDGAGNSINPVHFIQSLAGSDLPTRF